MNLVMPQPFERPPLTSGQRTLVVVSLPGCTACEALETVLQESDLARLDVKVHRFNAADDRSLDILKWLAPTDFPSAYLFEGDLLIGGWVGYSAADSTDPANELYDYLSRSFEDVAIRGGTTSAPPTSASSGNAV